MHNKYYKLLGFVGLGLAGCGAGADGYGTTQPMTQPPTTWKAKLQVGSVSAPIDPTASTLSVSAQHGQDTGAMTLPVLGGEATVEADEHGQLVLDALDLPLGDVQLVATPTLPGGLHLTDVRLSLATPAIAATTWIDDDDATATVKADLDLDWSLVGTNDTVVPLETVKIAGVPMTIDLTTGELRVGAAQPGVFWSWAGLASLSDLDATVVATMPTSF